MHSVNARLSAIESKLVNVEQMYNGLSMDLASTTGCVGALEGSL